MLKKINRLLKKKDFNEVFKKGRFFKDDFLVFRVLNNNLEYSRVGLVIGTKISKKAVLRNKIRRHLSECFRLKISSLKVGFDVVVLPNISILSKNYKEIQKNVDNLLIKSKLV